MFKLVIRCFLFLTIIIFSSTHTLSAAEKKYTVTYEKDIKNIISEKCSYCHGSDSPTLKEFRKDIAHYENIGKLPRLDTYQYLMVFINGEDMGALPKRIDDGKHTVDGQPGSMYVHLGEDEEERRKNLQLFKDWIGYWNVKTKDDIENEIEQEWLADMLSGEDTVLQDPKDMINEIISKIKAPES